ncbi:hypothetical protein JQX13_03130 [Archangium violaceum]|uniref:hypothetical protein n=1 Tax=Archangium violaceum TaxID=83451 RepID=UPI00193C2D6B|nr:hypothetical protein [Archangium violaceum]QRK09167.1 hypothetical protein JQX13_03130 [Archangium violaceum]
MGHQIRFFLTPADLQILEQRLKAHCPVVYLDYRSEQPVPRLLSTLAVAEFGKTWLPMLLVPPESLEALSFENVMQQGYWTVDLLRSPAIELSRCFYDGKILRVGRLFYDRGFYDETGNWVEKPAAFQAWAKKVFSVARKGLQRDVALDAYVGENAQAERQRAGLRLVST